MDYHCCDGDDTNVCVDVGWCNMKLIFYGIIFLLAFSIVRAEYCNISDVAKDYIVQHNLSIPTTELGCERINDKFTITDKQCWVVRERDNKSFKGILGKFMDGSTRCFIPSSNAKNDIIVYTETNEVPEYGLLAGGIALVGSLIGMVCLRKK
jgi:hypothetical protein